MSFKDILLKNGITPSANPNPDATGSNGGDNGGGAGGDGGTDGGGTGDGGAAGGAGGDPDIDESVLLATLKKKGFNINSLSELQKPAPVEPTEEEKRAAAQARKDEVRKYGLVNKKVTSTDLDNFAADSARSARDIAYEAWVEANYPDEKDRPEAADLADEFNEEFLQYADETDPKRLRKEKQLQQLADQRLRSKYGKIYDLDQDYEGFVADQQLRTEYNSTVDQAFQAIGDKLKFTIGTGKDALTYDYTLTPEAIAEAKKNFLSDGSFDVFGRSKMTAEAVQTAIEAGIKSKHMDEIISYMASTHASKLLLANGKGRRGIPEEEGGTQRHQPKIGTGNSAMQRQLQKNKDLIS